MVEEEEEMKTWAHLLTIPHLFTVDITHFIIYLFISSNLKLLIIG